MKNKKLVFWTIVTLFAVAYAGIQIQREKAKLNEWVKAGGGVVDNLPDLGVVPHFEFVDSNGNKITLESLKGKIWVLNLNRTNCESPCYLMSNNMSQLQRFFKVGDHIRLLTVTIDPDFDSNEKLNDYAQSFKAEANIWWFLRAEKTSLVSFAEAIKLPLDLEKMTSSTRFMLVDQQGIIRGYFDSLNKNNMEALRATITAMLKKEG